MNEKYLQKQIKKYISKIIARKLKVNKIGGEYFM